MARLKKGSPAAKAWGRKMKRLRAGTSVKKKSRSTTPKRRKSIKQRKRTMPKKKRKVSRKSKTMSFWGINLGKGGAAALYGAVRARASNYLAPYTSKIPAGAISDEIGMLAATQLVKKFAVKKAGILRDALTLGQAIEFARIGEAIATGQVNLGSFGNNQQEANGNLF